MIHRTTNTTTGQWLLRLLLVLWLILGAIRPALAPLTLVRQVQPMEAQMRAVWRDGATTYETAPVPATPAPVTVVSVRPTYASDAYAAASRKARTPARPSTCLPRNAWGESRWCPVTGKIDYSPFNDPSLLYYIGTVRQAVGSPASFRAALAAAVDTDVVEMTANIPLTVQSSTDILYPNRGDAGWVLVRTSSYASLPAVSASNYASAANKPSVSAWNGHPRFLKRVINASTISFANGARGWHHRGVIWDNDRIKTDTTYGVAGATGTFINWAVSGQGTYLPQPTYLVMDQCASRSYSGQGSLYEVQTTMTFGGQYYIVRRCRMDANLDVGEAKCIGGAMGLGSGLVVDNTIVGGSIHILMGGGATGLSAEYNSDIIYRQNYGVRDPNNYGEPSMGFGGGVSWSPGSKNFYEFKDGGRSVYEGNVLGGHDSRGQPYDFSHGPKAQSAASAVWTRVADVLFRHNKVTLGADAIGYFNTTTASTFPSLNGLRNLEYYNNLACKPYDATLYPNPPATVNDQSWVWLSGSTGVRVTANVKIHQNTTTVRADIAIGTAGVTIAANTLTGLNMFDNVLERDAKSRQNYVAMIGGSGSGTSTRNSGALDLTCGLGNWTVRNNLTNWTGRTDSTAWGATLASFSNRCSSAVTMQFTNIATDDYTLAEPAYQTMSTTGGRPGVNMTTLNALISGVTA